MYALLLLAAAVLGCGGCSDDGGRSDDAPNADAGGQDAGFSDAAASAPLSVRWTSSPMPTAAIDPATTTVSSVMLHIDQLQVIGDAGEPDATTAMGLALSWSQNFGPADTQFSAAPPALYSKVKIIIGQAGQSAPAIDIMGTIDLGGATPELFRVKTNADTSLQVSGYTAQLQPSGTANLEVVFDLSEALRTVDIASLPHANGIYTLDDSQGAAMNAFLGNLDAAFQRPGL